MNSFRRKENKILIIILLFGLIAYEFLERTADKSGIDLLNRSDFISGVVSAASPEAAKTGREILEIGGNAIDAAVAVALALGVTEPAGSGLGGQIVMIVYQPGREPFVINGTSFAPLSIPANMSTTEQLTGRRATTIPTMVKTLEFAWKKYGSGRVSWQRLLAPAIRYAEHGFQLGEFRQYTLAASAEMLRKDSMTAMYFLNKDCSIPETGSLFKQPTLANTLRRLAKTGAQDFYRGLIAKNIALDMKNNDGWLTSEDLWNTQAPRIIPAIRSSFMGADVYTLPPPYGGWVALQILNIIELSLSKTVSSQSSEWNIILAKALRAGHRSRRNEPVQNLIMYEEEIADRISKEKAKMIHELEKAQWGETTHFCIADKSGIIVSVSQSINNFYGACIANPDHGFLYNDYLHEFVPGNREHAYSLKPGGIPYSSMSATIVAREGKPILALGSPGSKRIISSIVQVIVNWMFFGMSIEEAVRAPRIHVEGDNLLVFEETGHSAQILKDISSMGFETRFSHRGFRKNGLDPYFGGVHAIAFEEGRWIGTADPRRDGAVEYCSGREK